MNYSWEQNNKKVKSLHSTRVNIQGNIRTVKHIQYLTTREKLLSFSFDYGELIRQFLTLINKKENLKV